MAPTNPRNPKNHVYQNLPQQTVYADLILYVLLKAFRKAMGITDEGALKTTLNGMTLSDYEEGNATLTALEVFQLVTLYGANVRDFYDAFQGCVAYYRHRGYDVKFFHSEQPAVIFEKSSVSVDSITKDVKHWLPKPNLPNKLPQGFWTNFQNPVIDTPNGMAVLSFKKGK